MMRLGHADEERRRASGRAARNAERVAVAKTEDGRTLVLPAALFGAFAVALLIDTVFSLISS